MQSQPSNTASLGDNATARPLRPLLPAASIRNEAPPTQSKRARVSLACAACRSRKTKCNGDRPSCSECVSRDSPCQYSETENTQTKRKHRDLEKLFQLLKSLPEDDASELLARIRAGVDPREIVDTVRHGNMLVQFASAIGSSGTMSSEADGGIGSSSGRGGSSSSFSGSGSGDRSGDSQEPRRDPDSPLKQSS